MRKCKVCGEPMDLENFGKLKSQYSRTCKKYLNTRDKGNDWGHLTCSFGDYPDDLI